MTRDLSPGVLLAQAADMAFTANRFGVGALIRLEDAEAALTDSFLVTAAELLPLDVRRLVQNLFVLEINLLHLADAYGHYEVQRRGARSR